MQTSPTILIIIGITGDLAQRKLLPAIGKMAQAGALPQEFHIIGITRRSDVTVESLLDKTENSDYITEHTELFQMDLASEADYGKLGNYLESLEGNFSEVPQRLFYLSVPPQVSRPIIEYLGASGLAKIPHTKLLLEKPFGTDLESAEELIDHINKYFTSEQIYRIDHYLARDTAQNLIIFREYNPLFKRTWNKDFIERIEITASEAIGIEGRAVFYEQTGALRDFMQSHLLQLAALALMDTPRENNMQEVPELRLKALRELHLTRKASSITDIARRGQYKGYRDEVGNPNSIVETFASIHLESVNKKWEGVPITLTTGKALKERYTEIRIFYKKEADEESEELTLRLQPDEGVELCIWAKRPGYEHELTQHKVKFVFGDRELGLPEPYGQVLFSAIKSDHTLFTSGEEVLQSWKILTPIQHAWEMSGNDLIFYTPGNTPVEVLAQNM